MKHIIILFLFLHNTKYPELNTGDYFMPYFRVFGSLEKCIFY